MSIIYFLDMKIMKEIPQKKSSKLMEVKDENSIIIKVKTYSGYGILYLEKLIFGTNHRILISKWTWEHGGKEIIINSPVPEWLCKVSSFS